MAFQIRKRPPAMRIRSRHENCVSKLGTPAASSEPLRPRSNTGAVSPTSQAIIDKRPSRITSASVMPMRRALARWCSGSLFERIEMKIRLSMPSTTSMITRATRAAQAVGSEKRA
ncbi:MAG: hypothetical protein EOO26_03805 [Comamonadaceae bacterium]|nr:MAG: hypothetical protein EOO26_03805 [Comamonadaceae bacterium]